MSRLDEAIADVGYILDVLKCHRSIVESGSCNDCKRDCGYMPKPGELVRYNCPFHERIGAKE